MGIGDLAHQNMNTLSGGMRQRAYLAMAFAQDTKYILCDENIAENVLSYFIKKFKPLYNTEIPKYVLKQLDDLKKEVKKWD